MALLARWLPASQRLVVNNYEEVLPTGDMLPVVGTPYDFSTPGGNTPLGNSLTLAGQAVMESPLTRKHVLFITDGMNTSGPKPEDVMPMLQRKAEQKGTSVSVHFVAFDVDAKVFEPVKRLHATVVSAADEKQLNTQLNFILQRKILLEEEEPPEKKVK